MPDDPTSTGHISPFETIRQLNEEGNEYWSARAFAKLLGYAKWDKFQHVIAQASTACVQSGHAVTDHFLPVGKMVPIGSGAQRRTGDYHLSRYACYLIVQNADPNKPIVALGQTYFAVQTRRQELADGLAALPEDQRRLIYRAQMAILNTKLAEAAQGAGVLDPLDFATFHDHGYMGLYGGLRENDIHARKGLAAGQHILDYMGSEELIDNAFRASQAEAKIRREQITGKEAANQTHFEVGKKVRQTIEELGGVLPEHLPTPSESIQQIERREAQRLQRGPQLALPFDDEGETAMNNEGETAMDNTE
jgi:DNA-damage-inducible protein D